MKYIKTKYNKHHIAFSDTDLFLLKKIIQNRKFSMGEEHLMNTASDFILMIKENNL